MAGLKSKIKEFAENNRPISKDNTRIECDFIQRMANSINGRNLLDIGCGIGRHTIELTERDFNVTGFDIDKEVISYARKAAIEKGILDPTFYTDNFYTFKTKNKYDIAYMMYHTLAMAAKNDDLLNLLVNIRNVLTSNGLFIFHLYSEWKFISEETLKNDSFTEETVEDDATLIQKMNVKISNVNNIRHQQNFSKWLKDGKEYADNNESYLLRVFSYNEIDLLSRLTGFQIESVYSGFQYEKQITDFFTYDDNLDGFGLMYVLKKN